MLEMNKKEVLEAYLHLKNLGTLSVNLENPTTSNLRNECVLVFSKRPDERLKSILSGFGVEIINAQDIRRIDADKFRPLRNFIIGDIKNPTFHTIELLAWLIDYKKQNRQFFTEKKSNMTLVRKHFKKGIMVTAALLLAYLFWPKPKCMYWNGEVYESVSCEEGVSYTPKAVKMDKEKLSSFKRITAPDTLTYYSVNKVWYARIDSFPEFYTQPGMHPVAVERRLKPVSKYIIDKYILQKKTLDSSKLSVP